MHLMQFLLRFHFGLDRPKEIHPFRWEAMIKWAEARKKYNEPEVYPDF